MLQISRKARILRQILRWIAQFGLRILTRTDLAGAEHLQQDGATLYVANHPSSYDPAVFFGLLPKDTQLVGPGDFRLKFPNRIAVEHTDIILVKRGYNDTKSLAAMIKVLKEGGKLAMFPEGGTWEKTLYDVKSGAAYLSWACKAQIVPIAISGTYDIWHDLFRLKRPLVTVRVGEPIPPVEVQSRKTRQDDLQEASYDMMDTIYDMLTSEEQERYDYFLRQQFEGMVEIDPDESLPEDNDFHVLAELVSKKNLVSPFHEHSNYPIQPFLNRNRFYSVTAYRTAVDALLTALREPFKEFISFRLGEEKSKRIIWELETMQQICQNLQRRNANARLRFQARTRLLNEVPHRPGRKRMRNETPKPVPAQ